MRVVMFDTFDSASDVNSARRFALSTTASICVFVLIGVVVATTAGKVSEVIKEKKGVDVVFRPPPPPVVEVKPPPPPPPPPPKPKLAPKPAPPAAAKAPPPAAPAVAPAPIVAPTTVPLDKPPEAEKEVVAAAPIAVGGTGALVPGGVVGGTGTAGGTLGGGGGRAAPINLPETGTPPEPLSSNVIPEYPSDARAKGLEGMVILKGVVEVDGRITQLKVMRGDEPFASAALAAVKTWRFKPAVVGGQPTAVYRIFKVPFRLKS